MPSPSTPSSCRLAFWLPGFHPPARWTTRQRPPDGGRKGSVMRARRADPTVLAALLLTSLASAPLAAQSSETAALRVRVTDAATGLPIGGAQVGFPELPLFRLANDAGIAQIVDIPPGVRTLEVTMLG